MSRSARTSVFLIAVVCAGAAATAQTPDAVKCEDEAKRRNEAWATAPHGWLANAWHIESRDIQLDLCRLRASRGSERLHHGEDLARVLFTGEGIHPVVGTIAPGNGLAGGVALNHAWASAERPLRFSGSAETRVSVNGSWLAGATLNVVGSSPSRSNTHVHAVFEARHAHINQVSYFGIGGQSANEELLFGLAASVVLATVESPRRHGFTVFGQLEGLHTRPFPFAGSGALSIEQRFSDVTTPAIDQATTYGVGGGGLSWRYPEDDILTGYATRLGASVRRFQETGGRPYSFTRADVTWIHEYTPDTAVDAGTFSATARFTASAIPNGQRVPFYLQPTIGGSDLDGQPSLRGYHDYRFRAPNILVALFEYAHVVRDPVGIFAFGDVGTVGETLGVLRTSRVKDSFGAGFTFRVGGAVFGRFFYAWSPEGSRLILTGNSNGGDAAMRGVF